MQNAKQRFVDNFNALPDATSLKRAAAGFN